MRPFLRRLPLVVLAGVTMVPLASSAAHADDPGLQWHDEGDAETTVAPLTFSFKLEDFNDPKEIRSRQDVELDIYVGREESLHYTVCSSSLTATPLLDAVPLGDSVELISARKLVADIDYVLLPVASRGTYALRIEGTVSRSADCRTVNATPEPFSTTIDLFTIPRDLPPPAGTAKVTITSSGPTTLVASRYRKSKPIRITFTVKDPRKRNDLLYSMCWDTYDCWFWNKPLEPSSLTKRTSTGWVQTWDYGWERVVASDCLLYNIDRPRVPVIMRVSNRDGEEIGRAKHWARLTCNP